ncbi:MAG: hypothetical protein U5L76_00240 [Patescibacteria group bacterium]|nr:hypothetical protein [Patescibacteria group bacterium]
MRIFRKIKNKIKGMSLMETILAVGLVMSVIIGSLTIGIYTTRIGRSSQNRLIAINLAQEGVEVVRNIRDTNWLKENSWNDGLAEGTYKIDQYVLTSPPEKWFQKLKGAGNCDDSNPCWLYLDNDYGFYSLNSTAGKNTGFSRVIEITNIDVNTIQVVSRINWQENGKDKEYLIEEKLTDWRDD